MLGCGTSCTHHTRQQRQEEGQLSDVARSSLGESPANAAAARACHTLRKVPPCGQCVPGCMSHQESCSAAPAGCVEEPVPLLPGCQMPITGSKAQAAEDRAVSHLQAELMSVPSLPGCQMPITGNPRVTVHVCHMVSRWFWRTCVAAPAQRWGAKHKSVRRQSSPQGVCRGKLPVPVHAMECNTVPGKQCLHVGRPHPQHPRQALPLAEQPTRSVSAAHKIGGSAVSLQGWHGCS